MEKTSTFFTKLKGFSVSDRGHLLLNGVDLVDLASLSERPLYVMNEVGIRQNIRAYQKALQDFYPAPSSLFYASKAFLVTAMAHLLGQEGVGIDVCSEGELFMAQQAGLPSRSLLMHGNNKSERELENAVQSHIFRIVVDNEDEISLLENICKRLGKKCDVLLRMNPEIQVDTHHYIATGVKDSKFGFPVPKDHLPSYILRLVNHPFLNFKGLHFHIGSNIRTLNSYKNTIKIVANFSKLLYTNLINTEDLNIGGGLGIAYQEQDLVVDIPSFVQEICGEIIRAHRERDLPLPRLLVEPGRSIVGNEGCTLYKVGALKEVRDDILYAAVNGGMSDNIRPSLYQVCHEAVIGNKMNGNGPLRTYKIVGKCCESGDVLIDKITLPLCERGDTLVVFSTGAYNHALASTYNKLPIPGVIFVREGAYDWVSQEESLADLMRRDLIPPHLSYKQALAS